MLQNKDKNEQSRYKYPSPAWHVPALTAQHLQGGQSGVTVGLLHVYRLLQIDK
jgi:hypothetical protein